MCFFVLLTMSCMRLNESPLLCYAMLCYVLCVFCSPTAKWRRCFISLCSPTAKWRQCCLFPPIGAEMAEVHVYWSLFHSVCGGRGRPLQTQLRCGHYGRNTLTTPPVSSSDRTPTPPPPRLTPTSTIPARRCVSV